VLQRTVIGVAHPSPKVAEMLGKSPSLPWLVGAVGPEKARRRLTSSASSVSAVRRNINGGNKNGIFSRHNLTDAAVLGIAKATDSIGSDFEKARVLLQIVSSHPMGKTTQQAMLETAGHIGSDYERGRVLSAMLHGGALSSP